MAPGPLRDDAQATLLGRASPDRAPRPLTKLGAGSPADVTAAGTLALVEPAVRDLAEGVPRAAAKALDLKLVHPGPIGSFQI